MKIFNTFGVNYLISEGIDPKTVLGESIGVHTGIMYGAPNTIAGVGNMCAHASAGCIIACLYTAGHGRFTPTQQARINRTTMFMLGRDQYWSMLLPEIDALVRTATRKEMIAGLRPNGTTDHLWEKTPVRIGGVKLANNIMEMYPELNMYDYTKYPYAKRANLPDNYDLTFSRSETNDHEVLVNLDNGRRVAVVFDTKKWHPLPDYCTATDGTKWPVIDGDLHDVRFFDPPSVIVGLRAKGEAKKDVSGFVVCGTCAVLGSLGKACDCK